jgi:cobalt-zinc-cadmium efflux system outer membrane protein
MMLWTSFALAAPLALSEVEASVDRWLPTLAIAAAEVDGAEGELLAARGAFDLTLSGVTAATPVGSYAYQRTDLALKQKTTAYGLDAWAKYAIGTGDIPSYDADLETGPQGEVAVGLDLPLLRNGWTDKDRLAVRVAQFEVDSAEARAAAARIGAIADARTAWWKWVAAGAKRSLAADLLAVSEARARAVDRRIAAGDLPPVDALDNARAVAERRAGLAAAERELAAAAYKLGLFSRGDDGRPAPPAIDQLPPVPASPPPSEASPASTWVGEALARRPELRELEAARQAADAKGTWGRNQRLPELTVTAGVGREIGPDAYPKAEVKVGALLDVPLQQRVGRGVADAADAKRLAIEAKAGFQRDKIEAEVNTALVAVETAAQRWAAAAESRQLSAAVLDAVRLDFEAGGATLFDVYLREQSWIQAANTELSAVSDYGAALAERDAAAGRP